MKVKTECLGCRYFERERIESTTHERTYYIVGCRLGFEVKEGSEPCKVDEE